MSFLSLTNFAAPFKQKFHLIAMILIIAVFLVLRFSGAKIEVQSVGNISSPQSKFIAKPKQELLPTNLRNATDDDSGSSITSLNDTLAETRRLAGVTDKTPQNGSIKIKQDGSPKNIDEILKKQPLDSQPESQESNQASLSEIEKKLGLR